ncbi:MAG TPA: malto-oligosyltrehalose synthase [Candidatus Binatia bacterium]|nr:malto-oligosyltrehalose synthase [Candidatus Binatia bacterium]
MPPDRRPRATYRLQLRPGFGFDEAAALVDYLAALGVSHLYCSPVLEAAAGSTHGYDVVDPRRLRAELGGAAAYDRLARALAAAGLGQVLDIVPNHMAVTGRQNVWWWDVLENGPSSLYARYFDIDWDPPEAKLRHTVLLPILGDHYGRVLEAGELRLEHERGRFTVRYWEHVAPVSPRSLDAILVRAAERIGERADQLASIATALGRLPPAHLTDWESVRERHRDKEVLLDQLARLTEEDPAVREAIDAVVAETNANPDALDALLQRQNYRLARWQTAGRELDYRRFFDVPTLVALRTEDPIVFHDTHALVLDLVRTGRVQGLRVDHPDGLRDPQGYLEQLRAEVGGAYVVVEKILQPDERLPREWPVDGTTGYEWLNLATGLFVDPAGEEPLTDLYTRFTGDAVPFDEHARRSRLHVLRDALPADLDRLAAFLVDVCERHRRYRDYTRAEAREALRATLVRLPVYRTYVRPGVVRPEDAARVTEAVERATADRPDLDPELLVFLRDVLLLRHDGEPERELAARFQQVSAAVMAKGVEDTAFYRYGRLVALNEVGGDPARFGTTVEAFHRRNAETAATHPGTMLATSTHDTKRAEDVRARLVLLSQMPERWASAVWRWAAMNARHRTDDRPDRGMEYLLYQTVVGAHPLPRDRAQAYMEKAAREAKVHTSWIDPQAPYEAALAAFVAAVVEDASFAADLAAFLEPLVEPARTTSVALTLLKATAPGVADVYQGAELWDTSLVDPDNRRPVDFAARRALLAWLDGATPEDVRARAETGAPKLFVLRRALDLRRRHPAPFDGDYVPLAATGAKAGRVVGFVRGGEVATVVPRLVLGLEDWGDTAVPLPPGGWTNELTGDAVAGGAVPLASLLARFPVALLRRA